jgi:hypothetical protein
MKPLLAQSPDLPLSGFAMPRWLLAGARRFVARLLGLIRAAALNLPALALSNLPGMQL